MEKNILKIEDFKSLIEAQNTLNEKFSGERWFEEIPSASFLSASFAELGELLESSPRTGDDSIGWKWWKKYLENDENNIKIEAVDMVHFNLSLLMKRYDMDFEYMYRDYLKILEEHTDHREFFEGKGVSHNLLISQSMFSIVALEKDDYSQADILDAFILLMDAICRYSKMNINEIVSLYFKKNELNHKRVDGGYLENKYEKINENGEEDNVSLFKS